MKTHSGIDDPKSTSSKENNNKGGASSYESNTVSKMRNLPSDKLYEIIKMLSRFLCKIRGKNIELKKLKINLESRLIHIQSQILKI